MHSNRLISVHNFVEHPIPVCVELAVVQNTQLARLGADRIAFRDIFEFDLKGIN